MLICLRERGQFVGYRAMTVVIQVEDLGDF